MDTKGERQGYYTKASKYYGLGKSINSNSLVNSRKLGKPLKKSGPLVYSRGQGLAIPKEYPYKTSV